MRKYRLLILITLPLFAAGFAVMVSLGVRAAGAAGLVSPDSIDKPFPVAIVPGAAVWGRWTLSHVLEDRVLVAIRLYRAGRVKKLLFSGRHDREDYDEVNAMRRYAMERGVPAADIFLDHAGFTTYQTLYRARAVFRVERALIVSQRYHLYRALYIAGALGIAAKGVASDLRPYVNIDWYRLRDFFARIKAWFQAGVFRPLPDHLGRPHPVTGDGRSTHDMPPAGPSIR